jgi:PAS domain S-box-containing protein
MFQLLREAADRLSNMLRAQQLEAAKSHAILEGVADGVMVTDAHGEIILFNAAAERILQIHRTDVIGRSVSEMPGIFGLAGTSWAELTEMWGEGNPDPDREVLYDERLELDQRVISMRVAPVTRENVFEGTVSVFRDITKDVEVDRMKSEFVSTVSHELRTPMTSIKGYIDLMYSGMAGNITPKQERFLQIVKTNADRLTLLVNDLLDISRIEMGRLKLNPKPVELSNTVDVVLDNHAPEAQQRQQTLRNEIEDPLPLVQVDPARLAQVLTNLVSNAVHYTPNGGSISVRAEVVDDVVQIHVQDTGIGIKEEDKSKLFSRFYRAEDPLVQARSGTGLGLVIVKSIVELHGGEMWFESTPGQGSTFSLSLPLAEKATETPPRQFKTISYRPHDKHILIIEGEPKVAERISYQLQAQERYQIHVERSGQAAVEYLIEKQRQPDLILLDLDLPDMEGLDVLRTIQSHERLSAIPIVTLSLSLEESDGKARISRPMRANDLVNAVNAVFAESADDLDVRRRKVLLVEDDEQLAELFTVVLTQKGFMVTINKEPHQALALAIKDRPDLVLLDLTRADQVGYDILDQLKHTEATQDIPVLVITGEALDLKERSRQDLDVMSIQLPEAPVQVDEFVSDVQSALTSDAQTSSSN